METTRCECNMVSVVDLLNMADGRYKSGICACAVHSGLERFAAKR